MQWYELEACINGLENNRKNEWEQTRKLFHVTAQVNSTKELDPKKIFPLPWDEENRDTTISNEDIERLKAKAKKYEKILNNG